MRSMEQAQIESLRPLRDAYASAGDAWQRCSLAITIAQLQARPDPGTDWEAAAIRDCDEAGEPVPASFH